MTDQPLILISAVASAMGFAGFVFGIAYFAALRRTVDIFTSGKGWFAPVAWTILRIAGAVAFLALIARFGVPSLLAASLGFLFARTLALRSERGAGR